jgi:hypothetical protein
MAKKLFTVHVETTLVVVAESDAQALVIAEDVARIEGAEVGLFPAALTSMPADWDKGCIPFGAEDEDEDDDDRTIGQWIEAGAAPEFKE